MIKTFILHLIHSISSTIPEIKTLCWHLWNGRRKKWHNCGFYFR